LIRLLQNEATASRFVFYYEEKGGVIENCGVARETLPKGKAMSNGKNENKKANIIIN
jgi:hypothetical protein